MKSEMGRIGTFPRRVEIRARGLTYLAHLNAIRHGDRVMNYFENLNDTIIRANERSLRNARSGSVGTAKAWDNVKKKNGLRYRPRGNAYTRIVQVQNWADWQKLQAKTQDVTNRIAGA